MSINKQLKIGDLTAKLPIIQGGMGVGVSRSSLAGAVAKEGGVGIISTAQIGYDEEGFEKNQAACNNRAIHKHIKRAKEIAQGNGLVGVNIMVALKHYAEHVKEAVAAGADVIISGAGLPMNLPELVSETCRTKIAPIVSSKRAAQLILKMWAHKYDRTADFLVVEGPKAGGHLGFSREQLNEIDTMDYDEEIRQMLASLPHPVGYVRYVDDLTFFSDAESDLAALGQERDRPKQRVAAGGSRLSGSVGLLEENFTGKVFANRKKILHVESLRGTRRCFGLESRNDSILGFGISDVPCLRHPEPDQALTQRQDAPELARDSVSESEFAFCAGARAQRVILSHAQLHRVKFTRGHSQCLRRFAMQWWYFSKYHSMAQSSPKAMRSLSAPAPVSAGVDGEIWRCQCRFSNLDTSLQFP